MADLMTFPKTVDEFMEKYKIVDTEKVYTNGTELVPIFRVKQWFEHSEKHGWWIENKDRGGWHCSCCGKDDLYAYLYAENNELKLQDYYCPNCGAKMEPEGEEKE